MEDGKKALRLESLRPDGQACQIIFRQRNGKTIVSRKPAAYTISKKPECIAARNKFRTAAKFALFLSRVPRIIQLWETANIEGLHTYQKLVKYNAKKVSQFWPTKNNTITPPGYSLKIHDVILHDDNIKVIMEDWDETEDDKIIMIIVLYNKIQPDLEDFLAIDISPQNDSGIITLKTSEIKLYNRFIIYCAVTRQTPAGITWSNTHTLEGDFELYNN